MGNPVGKVANSTTVRRQETVLEAEKRDKIPRGYTMYLSEQIVNAITGKGPKDPVKILSNSLNQYSESPYYKVLKKAIKKTGEAAIWLFERAIAPPINGDMVPYYTGEGLKQDIYI